MIKPKPHLTAIPRNIRRAIKVPKHYLGHFDLPTSYFVYNSSGERVGTARTIDGKWYLNENLCSRHGDLR